VSQKIKIDTIATCKCGCQMYVGKSKSSDVTTHWICPSCGHEDNAYTYEEARRLARYFQVRGDELLAENKKLKKENASSTPPADDLALEHTVNDLHWSELHEAMCAPVPPAPMDASSPASWERGYMAARMVVVKMMERHREDIRYITRLEVHSVEWAGEEAIITVSNLDNISASDILLLERP